MLLFLPLYYAFSFDDSSFLVRVLFGYKFSIFYILWLDNDAKPPCSHFLVEPDAERATGASQAD